MELSIIIPCLRFEIWRFRAAQEAEEIKGVRRGGGITQMVAGMSSGDHRSGGGRRSMSAAAKRGRGRAGGRPGGPAAHPERKGVVGAARERTGTPESSRRAAAEVDEGEDTRVGVGPPGPIPPVGREQRTRRSG